MKLTIFLIFFVSFHFVESFKSNKSSNFNIFTKKSFKLSKPVAEFLKTVKFEHLEVVMCSADEVIQDFLSEIMENLLKKFWTVKIYQKTFQPKRIFNCLILCDNFFKLTNFTSINPEVFNFCSYLAIAAIEISRHETEIFTKKMWEKQVFNIVSITELDNTFHALSFAPFNSGTCDESSTQVVNRLVNGKWSSSKFFPENLGNLQNCTLKVAALENLPTVIKKTFKYGSVVFDGIEVELLREIAKTLNFYASIDSTDTDYGSIFEGNKTFTGNL